ncbi:uncharacterized protein L3040_003409 [Drepanopeziza brunnea f. sp. 'multigermtubi']|uniref:U1 zinc finger protein n=1 Tax=Marssonina brunnea f. sp. multigermtubi (strain MB_m1) TaxID=1072389 RepID=K1WU30_MARBU|nr:U1 zinc finger protein [Drepanopeziza brunnea f. sp. 'multigermtubi' MB_m1]EKD15972.1 U1 zinc finger protein [Drepanopeziza brunnea f. sp. 'multigermtubi' MB_m1]KAJ5047587.1 hypothetical protein L3040_003409 [Drepanopeziza brunnea f. sp. 'multigermtubi']
MSEYWKSTPKYWCKHCKTYVRDTKLEKANHDATPKHQGNLKRFLRDLHRGHEKDEKDKERSKMEVERLKGLVSGGTSGSGSSGPAASSSSSGFGRGPTPSIPKPQATEAQRKKQLAQLVEMGVTLPDEFRAEMAMPGEWHVTAERVIDPEGTEKKPEALALGVRKREIGEEEEELNEAKKRRWGSTYRTHPTDEEGFDLDALLDNATRNKDPVTKTGASEDVKPDLNSPDVPDKQSIVQGQIQDGANPLKPSGIKIEPSEGEVKVEDSIPPAEAVKQEDDQSAPGVVFKKRKAKNIRQK